MSFFGAVKNEFELVFPFLSELNYFGPVPHWNESYCHLLSFARRGRQQWLFCSGTSNGLPKWEHFVESPNLLLIDIFPLLPDFSSLFTECSRYY
jgi:hypothetical protein